MKTRLLSLHPADSQRPLLLGLAGLVMWAAIVTDARAQGTIGEQEEQVIKQAVYSISASVVRIETLGGLEKVGQVLVGTG
ncbi:MAG: hypothetical protein VB857_06810, partial [Pirellulaceae bacterium]